ncbi:putative allergen asp f 4 [Phaeomoniella chlamydospora]|uniref:Putative allergen asp f 4 n=1 Tax=Phaeomoniella chlamydospora TaxID=158046 RepID=A0A0G2EB37_PHACM|nr:putative allergen asp f 4 [Phaeomoniella chlamydospora]
MKFTSALLLTAVSAGALAQPAHRRHQKFHDQKRAVGDIVVVTMDGQVVSWVNEYDGSAATTTAAAASATAPAETSATATASVEVSSGETSASSTASASSASNSGSASTYSDFCSSSSKNKRATSEEIAYTGNTGCDGEWGTNWKLIDSDLVDDYDYTATFTLDDSNTEDWKCVCWNKIAPDGTISGWFGHSAVSFTLSPGSTQNVAIDSNTQGGCSCGEGSVPKSSYGAWAGTWLELDVDNTSNDGWSGTDISSLVATDADMDVQGMSVTWDSCTSTILSDGSGTNAYVEGTNDLDGVGCNIPAGSLNLAVTVGYSE